MENIIEFLKKLKIELPYDSAIPLLGIYQDKTVIHKDTCNPMFIAALFTIAKIWKQSKCPSTDEWIRKIWYIYTLYMVHICTITQPQLPSSRTTTTEARVPRARALQQEKPPQ